MPLSQNASDGRPLDDRAGAAGADRAPDRSEPKTRAARAGVAAEIARLEKKRRDLLQGFANLRERTMIPQARLRAEKHQCYKLAICEGKIFALRQLNMNLKSR